jgi:alkylation response protein AidB-like acyl-CoA dehydrogenase
MNRIFKWAADRQTASNRDVVTAYADVAKVSCTDLALENCQRALSLMGKEGLRHENGAEKLLRDVKLLQIYEGTNQVNMLDFVKRHLVRQFH